MNIYSFKDYLKLFNYFFYAAHPIIFVFAIVGICCVFKKMLRKPLPRFIIVLAVLDISLKCFKYYKTGIMTERYLLLLVVIFNILACYGIIFSSGFLYRRIVKGKKVKFAEKITAKNILYLIVMITAFFMIGQTLKPNFDKPWINGVNEDIQSVYKGTETPIIITNGDDSRIGYIANSKMLRLNLNNFYIWNKFKMLGSVKDEYSLKSGIENFQKNLKLLGGNNVFVFLEKIKADDFKKVFEDRNIQFPLKLIKNYYRNRKEYCLFQYDILSYE